MKEATQIGKAYPVQLSHQWRSFPESDPDRRYYVVAIQWLCDVDIDNLRYVGSAWIETSSDSSTIVATISSDESAGESSSPKSTTDAFF